MDEAPSGSWPLSAAATALLRNPKLAPRDVMKLTLKELVLRRVWRVERRDPSAGRRRRGGQALLRGERPVPPLPPLPLADQALRSVVPGDGGPVREMVRHTLSVHSDLPKRLRDDAHEELVRRGLVEVERRRVLGLIPRTVVTHTLSGRSWLDDIDGRESSLRTSIGRPSGELTPQLAAMGGLVLLLEPDLLSGLDEALRRDQDELVLTGAHPGGEPGNPHDDFGGGAFDDAGGLDLGDLGGFDAIDSGFDAAIDAGVSDGGGGWGDGGAGGDGGGGGGN